DLSGWLTIAKVRRRATSRASLDFVFIGNDEAAAQRPAPPDCSASWPVRPTLGEARGGDRSVRERVEEPTRAAPGSGRPRGAVAGVRTRLGPNSGPRRWGGTHERAAAPSGVRLGRHPGRFRGAYRELLSIHDRRARRGAAARCT